MKTSKILVTGSAGLIGSEVCSYFHEAGYTVFGIDNNQRATFFGPKGDTTWNRDRLINSLERYNHFSIDIRDRQAVEDVVKKTKPEIFFHSE